MRVGLIVPLLALIVFAIQLWFAETEALSRWKGGGFGMFSTLDGPGHRFTRVYARQDSTWLPLHPSWVGRNQRLAAKTLPDQENLSAWARTLANWRWTETDDGVLVRQQSEMNTPTAAFSTLRVEVWSLAYDRSSGELEAEPITQYVLKI